MKPSDSFQRIPRYLVDHFEGFLIHLVSFILEMCHNRTSHVGYLSATSVPLFSELHLCPS